MLVMGQTETSELAGEIAGESPIADETLFADTWRPAGPRHRVDLTLESNGEVMRKAGKGDDRAWNELFNRFGTMVLHVAQRMGLNAADAADVQQATWMQFMRHADQVRDPECVGAWLATTARRQSQRVAIAAGRQTLSPDPVANYAPVERSGEDVEAVVLRAEYDAPLQKALDRLPESYRRLLLLLTSDSCPSYEDAARTLNLPVGSIGPMRQRGLQMLRRDPELQKYQAASNGKSSTRHSAL
jgi:RNA polymerase sigma factor (sigma-70 family)